MQLRIATFNLESLDRDPRHGPALERRIEVLRPQLADLNADILCLQEVNAQEPSGHGARTLEALDEVLAGTPYATYARAVTSSSSGNYPADLHNLVILSRWPIVSQRQVWHEFLPPLKYTPATAANHAEIAVRFDRPLLYAEIALPNGQTLNLLNLHLKAPIAAAIPGQKLSPFVWKTTQGWSEGYFLAGLKRSGQALEARLLVDAIFDKAPDALIAVCGDLNAESRETPIRILLGDVQDTGNPALDGRQLVAVEEGVTQARRYSVLHRTRPVLLDHILVSRALSSHPHRVSIRNETLSDEVLDYVPGESPESFHAPIVAEFSLPD